MAPWLLLPWILLFSDTLQKDGSEGVAALRSGFLGTIVTLMPETALVSFRKLASFFELVTGTFSSFNATHSLSTLDHCPCLDSPVPGVKVSQSKFLIYTPLHHCLPFKIIGPRYLLMNLHVVADSRILNLYRLSRISSDGIFDMDRITSSHLVSNS